MTTPHTDTQHPLTQLSHLQNARLSAGRLSRRQPTAMQDAALEHLAHAAEYLIEHGLLCGDVVDPNVAEAVSLLSTTSRAIFLECEELPADAKGATPGTAAHIRWKWMPVAPFMLPLFRSHPHPSRPGHPAHSASHGR